MVAASFPAAAPFYCPPKERSVCMMLLSVQKRKYVVASSDESRRHVTTSRNTGGSEQWRLWAVGFGHGVTAQCGACFEPESTDPGTDRGWKTIAERMAGFWKHLSCNQIENR
ncbi:hypothetical protein ZHAS_00008959 [Anopheles sinensis]|uniref:Uncharacterized protein n=1 Tax=Anopheles sinensis TaxID=74873 RepID=A0A084VTT3_ANOSI|nr:hypothetical protein ZHAS_00008959 [Anopheles sinensis]